MFSLKPTELAAASVYTTHDTDITDITSDTQYGSLMEAL